MNQLWVGVDVDADGGGAAAVVSRRYGVRGQRGGGPERDDVPGQRERMTKKAHGGHLAGGRR
jgi:hypothetical protein